MIDEMNNIPEKISSFWYWKSIKNNTQKQSTEKYYEIGTLKKFIKLTGKHLCWSLFLNKVADLRPLTCL